MLLEPQSRTEYEGQNHEEYLPDNLNFDEIVNDEVTETEVGHTRIRYNLTGVQSIDGHEVFYEVRIIEDGKLNQGSIIRAAPETDSNAVYTSRSDRSPEEILDAEEPLGGEILDRNY